MPPTKRWGTTRGLQSMPREVLRNIFVNGGEDFVVSTFSGNDSHNTVCSLPPVCVEVLRDSTEEYSYKDERWVHIPCDDFKYSACIIQMESDDSDTVVMRRVTFNVP